MMRWKRARRRRKTTETFFNRPATYICYNYISLKCKLVKKIISLM
jgi:hypothetical protein